MKKGFLLFEFLCALVLGVLVVFYASSFWVRACDSLSRLTNSSYSFLAVMHSVSFVRSLIAQAPPDRASWKVYPSESFAIGWREGAILKKLIFKEGMLFYQMRDGKTFSSKVLIKGVSGSFELFMDTFVVRGVRMNIHTRTKRMTTFFHCLPVLKV